MEENYRDIHSLGRELAEGLTKMNSGEMSIGELESLTEIAREVYERLVILRYKAYDELVEEAEDSHYVEGPGAETPANANQISLIDAIGEAAPDLSPESEVSEAAPISLSIDFTAVTESVVQEEKPADTPIVVPGKPAPELNTTDASINDKLAREESSLADKLSKSPIADLRKAVGLNQKFSFISALFAGDSKAYDQLMESLNAAPDYVEAARIVRDEMKKRSWDAEDHNVLVLQNLIERRFQ